MMEPMSDQPARKPTDPALRTRVLMGGAFLGALVAMTLSWLLAWVPESPQVVAQRQAEQKEEQIAQARQEAFRSPPGSCLNWTNPDASDVKRVSCDDEHLFEVVGLADLSSEYGPKARLPDEQTWRELTEQRCGELVEDYLDGPLDPEGKLSIGVLRPDEAQWSGGDRTLHCGLQWAGPGGGLQVLSEPAEDVDQSAVWEPGTCLALVDKSVGDPTTCDSEHSYEIVALVDLADEFDAHPSEDDQMAWLDPTCAEEVEEYTGGRDVKDLADDGLIVSWDIRSEESWEAGSTLVNCKVGAVLEDDSGLAPVRGSVQEGADDADEPQDDGEQQDGDGGDSGGDQDGGDQGSDGSGDSGDGGDADGGDQGGDDSDDSGEAADAGTDG
ncbi:septum formation family protein [Saccharomonospora piscinae]|uniref:septum formation family protein n=1 Tax=Saccharomonospora piscinae TaxID=687388 RepID=UPI0004631C35|nr:septum formation family protein [Saccharomonospora piscinae]